MTPQFGIPAFPLLLGLAFLSCSANPGRADTDSGEKIYQKALRSTVWIVHRKTERTFSSGTGSLIDKSKRLVITNYHVVGDAKEVTVFFPLFRNGKLIAERGEYQMMLAKGSGIPAEVLYRDYKHDLAIIQLKGIPAGAQALNLARKSVSPGQRVHSIGNPGKSDALWIYTSGTVRQVYKKKWVAQSSDRKFEFEAEVVMTQSPTNPGDSGGPLVNDQGELVAVTQGSSTNAQLISLFIDISEVKNFLASHRLTPKALASSREMAEDDETKPAKEAGTSSVQSAADKLEHRATTKLEFAKTLAADGKIEQAKTYCEKLISTFPTTKAAGEAKELLERLNK
jgi:S1-C subfamily serine protease